MIPKGFVMEKVPFFDNLNHHRDNNIINQDFQHDLTHRNYDCQIRNFPPSCKLDLPAQTNCAKDVVQVIRKGFVKDRVSFFERLSDRINTSSEGSRAGVHGSVIVTQTQQPTSGKSAADRNGNGRTETSTEDPYWDDEFGLQ